MSYDRKPAFDKAFFLSLFDYGDPKPPQRQTFFAASRKWSFGGEVVLAHTKSEARAILKKVLKLKRLPIGAKVAREEKSA